MVASKLILPPTVGLVAGNVESRKARLVLELEAAVVGTGPGKRIIRFRDPSGRWVRAATVIRRLEALGATLLGTETGPPGPHTPDF